MFFLLIPIFIGTFIYKLFKKTQKSLQKKHVLITGGSSGIGKSLAILCVKEGANVTIIGRNVDKLNEAMADIEKNRLNPQQLIHGVSLDVSNSSLVKKKFNEIEEKMGPVYMLGNCAGVAICGKLEDTEDKDVQTMLNTNFLGTLYPIQTILKSMKSKQEGIILITASQAALLGIYGMSVYSSTKFALRGLAESLHMEVKPYNISVTLALPPDTDTPGFAFENKSKLKETILIAGTGGLYKPMQVAKKMLKDTLVHKL